MCFILIKVWLVTNLVLVVLVVVADWYMYCTRFLSFSVWFMSISKTV